VRRLLRRATRAPALDRPWREAEYCVVDVETTGLDLRRDEVISFGSVVVRSGRLCCETAYYTDVRPGRPVGTASVSVHGLRDQDLDSAPEVGEVVGRIMAELDGRVLVAHAAWVERAFLGRALRSGGRRLRAPVVDTAALLRAAGLAASGTGHEPEVESTAERLGLCVHTPHHALGDALTTAEVLLAVVSRLERAADAPLTARDLVDVSRRHSRT
jgi:DNA polymerase III subunit epsilon